MLMTLHTIVLAGGHSRRMGRDKAWIAYHGRPQWQHLLDLVEPLVQAAYLSLRPDQVSQFPPDTPHLLDAVPESGPLGGLLSALRYNPAATWLVLACDLPWLDRATLQYLIGCHDPTAAVTAFRSPGDGAPEPLIALWTPQARPALEQAAIHQQFGLRRLMRDLPVCLLDAPRPQALQNVNRPADYSPEGLP